MLPQLSKMVIFLCVFLHHAFIQVLQLIVLVLNSFQLVSEVPQFVVCKLVLSTLVLKPLVSQHNLLVLLLGQPFSSEHLFLKRSKLSTDCAGFVIVAVFSFFKTSVPSPFASAHFIPQLLNDAP
jgi:hypothetical protein